MSLKQTAVNCNLYLGGVIGPGKAIDTNSHIWQKTTEGKTIMIKATKNP